jgi:hypothetical protein
LRSSSPPPVARRHLRSQNMNPPPMCGSVLQRRGRLRSGNVPRSGWARGLIGYTSYDGRGQQTVSPFFGELQNPHEQTIVPMGTGRRLRFGVRVRSLTKRISDGRREALLNRGRRYGPCNNPAPANAASVHGAHQHRHRFTSPSAGLRGSDR